MKTIIVNVFHERTAIPLIVPETVRFPTRKVEDFSHYCGAGTGIGDFIVPETVFGVKISPACFIHDNMWDLASPTWEAFHFSNSVFLSNIISLVEGQSKSQILKHLRLYRAVTYYNAVDSIGSSIFWNIKRVQKEEL